MLQLERYGLDMVEEDFLLESYNYSIEDKYIAQYPPVKRGESRLLCLFKDINGGKVNIKDTVFNDLPNMLPKGSLLIANNSRVLPARIFGERFTGGKVEFLLLTPLPILLSQANISEDNLFNYAEAKGLIRCGGKLQIGEKIVFAKDIHIIILEKLEYGQYSVRLEWCDRLDNLFINNGHIPLPPYIKRKDDISDSDRYQTIYANFEKNGSVAAPTAGLHFTDQMKNKLLSLGFLWSEVTLYVGYGTFSPVRCSDIRDHKMHSEYIEISQQTANVIIEAKKEGRPIIAIGTTSTRVLEGCVKQCGKIQKFSGWTDIFLYPSKKFYVIDGLLTNFHLPESTLLMLVSAFAGRKCILNAYNYALSKQYRFFSYGDAMLII